MQTVTRTKTKRLASDDAKLAKILPDATLEEKELWHEKLEFLTTNLGFPKRDAEESAAATVLSFRKFFAA